MVRLPTPQRDRTVPVNLDELGWDPGWQAAWDSLGCAGAVPARVVAENRHACTVVGASGDFPATVPGRLLHRAASPADLPKVGDWVAVTPMPGEDKGVVEAVLPRRTVLQRKVSGRTSEVQVLAANVDIALVLQALDQTLNARRLERFLVMVNEGGVEPVVVLNKADLCPDPATVAAQLRASCGGREPVVVSARTGRGVPQLLRRLPRASTVVLLGTSGVGKSSLLNRFAGERLQETLPVREADAKGRHTTTWRELVPLPGGALMIDSPGVREFHLWSADDGLDQAFPEITALAEGCRFRDCRHEAEAGCAVREAADAGRLDPARHAAFRKLQAELASVTTRARERARHRPSTERRPGRRDPLPDDGDEEG